MIVKTISARGSKGHHDFTLSVQEDSTQNNSSFISYTFKISATNSSWQWRSYSNISYTISINGTDYTGTIPNFNGSTTTLKTGSNIEIPHNSDGKKTIAIAFSVTDPNTSVTYTCGNASASDTMELTSLHKIPLMTATNVTENAVSGITNLQMVRYLSNKTYTITAEAYDGATISKYRVYNGSQLVGESNTNQVTVDYSNIELQTNVYNNVLYAIVSFEVEDSLGATRMSTYTSGFPIIEYNLPNIITTSSNIKRNGQSTGQVNLDLVATYTSGAIGSTTNAITLQFAYWEKGQTESTTYYTIPSSAYTISGDDITISSWTMYKGSTLIEDVSPSSAYYFKIKITDSFSKTNEVQLLCASGEYIMCKFSNRVDFKKITQQGRGVALEPIVAFYDANGDNGNLVLDYDASNYQKARIYFRTNDNDVPVASVDVDNPDGKYVIMIGAQPYSSANKCFIKSKKVLISGTTITNVNYSEVAFTNNASPTISNSNNIYITKVEFY